MKRVHGNSSGKSDRSSGERPFVAAVTAAIESHHGLIDDWASELRKQGDAYQETWYRSMCAARGPGWSDAMRASVEMTDPRYPALTRAFHARIESLAEGFHG